jgi:hypothetical protein
MRQPIIQTRRYDPAADYAAWAAWWHAHGGVPDPPDWLPRVGMLAYEVGGTPLAMAFLYQTDSPMAFLHGLVSNPGAPPRWVSRGLDAVVAAVLAEAQARGVCGILSLTDRLHVARRARRHGFRVTAGMMELARVIPPPLLLGATEPTTAELLA